MLMKREIMDTVRRMICEAGPARTESQQIAMFALVARECQEEFNKRYKSMVRAARV